MTTVSAVRDPFAEVTVVVLSDGASCVLQPRALAAVVQPIGQRLRVTGHWRLLSLNAWLTMQLRYLVFHGPARLVVQGGRGVRVERAERGRIFGQDQVVGFSSDLAYPRGPPGATTLGVPDFCRCRAVWSPQAASYGDARAATESDG